MIRTITIHYYIYLLFKLYSQFFAALQSIFKNTTYVYYLKYYTLFTPIYL